MFVSNVCSFKYIFGARTRLIFDAILHEAFLPESDDRWPVSHDNSALAQLRDAVCTNSNLDCPSFHPPATVASRTSRRRAKKQTKALCLASKPGRYELWYEISRLLAHFERNPSMIQASAWDYWFSSSCSGARFSKAPETFRARKAKAKSRTLHLQSCFIQFSLIWREVHCIQEVSGVYT